MSARQTCTFTPGITVFLNTIYATSKNVVITKNVQDTPEKVGISPIGNEKGKWMINEKLKDLRMTRGVSLQKVADATKTSKTYIWRLEKGKTKNPTLDVLDKCNSPYANIR